MTDQDSAMIEVNSGAFHALAAADGAAARLAVAEALIAIGWASSGIAEHSDSRRDAQRRFEEREFIFQQGINLCLAFEWRFPDVARAKAALGWIGLGESLLKIGNIREAKRMFARAVDKGRKLAASPAADERLITAILRLEALLNEIDASDATRWHAALASVWEQCAPFAARIEPSLVRIADAFPALTRNQPDRARTIIASAMIDIAMLDLLPKSNAYQFLDFGVSGCHRTAHRFPDMRAKTVRGTLAWSAMLAEEGDGREALNVARAAVEMAQAWRGKGVTDSDLGAALVHLGVRLAEAQRWEEALATTRNGLAHLASHEPENAADIAFAYLALGWQYAHLGPVVEAFYAIANAGEIHRRSPPTNPRMQRDCVRLLRNAGEAFARACFYDEAFAASSEAVHLLRAMMHANPQTHLPELADALITCSDYARRSGREAKALDLSDEALIISRYLDQRDHAACAPLLVRALLHQTELAYDMQRLDDALQASREAVDLTAKVARDGTASSAMNEWVASALHARILHQLALRGEVDLNTAWNACIAAQMNLTKATVRRLHRGEELNWPPEYQRDLDAFRETYADMEQRVSASQSSSTPRR